MAEPTASQSIREIFVVPLDSNKNYVHREALESSLASILAPEDKKERQCKRAALCGLGGSGKTQIAVRFAQDYRSFYSAVFWVSGLDEASLIDGFCYLAREVGVGTGQISEGNVDMATDWLVSNIGWLLIIDNVDSEEALRVLHRKFLTAGMRGSILITSRNELVKLRWTTIDVGNMSEAEGGQLLANITGAEDAAEGPVSDLLQSLGCLPLAIDQAASYIREAEVSVAEYLDLYHQEKTECLSEYPSTQYNLQSRETVITTWTISFDAIKKDSPGAALLLQMLALLDAEEFPLTILESCLSGQLYWSPRGEFEAAPEEEQWVPKLLKKVLLSRKGYIDAKKMLRRFSFIKSGLDSSLIYIHPLVHYWAAYSLEDDEIKNDLTLCLIGLVTSAFEKQDRLPPCLPRTYGARGIEEGKLGIWPWRQYLQLASHARRCLVLAQGIPQRPILPAIGLPLLQVLEYSTFGSLDKDNGIANNLLNRIRQADPASYATFSTRGLASAPLRFLSLSERAT
ncbi:hypothetical protein NW767_008532 [Fusarium falciforme]|nr:hypothetical protein NW767_008532 [Fusarium falciforme]